MNKPKQVSALLVMMAGASIGLTLATIYRVYRYLRAEQDGWDELESAARGRWMLDPFFEPAPPVIAAAEPVPHLHLVDEAEPASLPAPSPDGGAA